MKIAQYYSLSISGQDKEFLATFVPTKIALSMIPAPRIVAAVTHPANIVKEILTKIKSATFTLCLLVSINIHKANPSITKITTSARMYDHTAFYPKHHSQNDYNKLTAINLNLIAPKIS